MLWKPGEDLNSTRKPMNVKLSNPVAHVSAALSKLGSRVPPHELPNSRLLQMFAALNVFEQEAASWPLHFCSST